MIRGERVWLRPSEPSDLIHDSQYAGDVEVGHFLPRSLADVRQQSIALDDHFSLARDMADGADEAGNLGVRGGFRKIVP